MIVHFKSAKYFYVYTAQIFSNEFIHTLAEIMWVLFCYLFNY